MYFALRFSLRDISCSLLKIRKCTELMQNAHRNYHSNSQKCFIILIAVKIKIWYYGLWSALNKL